MNDNLYRILSSILFIAISYGIVFLIGNSFEQVNFSESFIYKSWGIIFLIQITGFIPSFLFKTYSIAQYWNRRTAKAKFG